jgi:opacity protein-like surface antigen
MPMACRLSGGAVGAGAEYVFTNRLIGHFEYRCSDFGSFDVTVPADDGSVNIDAHTVAVDIACKF